MGVRYLINYIKNDVHQGVKEIDIYQEIKEYKRIYKKNPTIVIDLLMLQRSAYAKGHEIILGGRNNISNRNACHIFQSLKSTGANLVFYMDGPTHENKMPAYLIRRETEYNAAIKILNAIYNDEDISIKHGPVPAPVPFMINYNILARDYSKVCISILNECDLELADYANRLNAFAVISSDTDFLIFEGKWRLWSAVDFKMDTMKTIEYNKIALRDQLGLTSDEMPILATLAGNDFVFYNYVKHLHRKWEPSCNKLNKMAKIIQDMRNSNKIETITKLIFSSAQQSFGRKLVKKSLNAYNYNTIRTQYDNEIIRNIAQDTNQFNYNILANRNFVIKLYYFDLRQNDLMPFYDLIQPLIRRNMGILLQHLNDHSVKRTFYCKTQHEQPYHKIKETPEYPAIQLPPILELLHDPMGTNLDEIRFELLCWQISSHLVPAEIQDLSKGDVINVLTLFYLRERQQITLDEADCLLLANYCPQDMMDSLKHEDVKKINGRNARIAFLFTRLQYFISNCFYCVGLGELSSLVTFDGLYYHYLCKIWNNDDAQKTAFLKAYNRRRIYTKFN